MSSFVSDQIWKLRMPHKPGCELSFLQFLPTTNRSDRQTNIFNYKVASLLKIWMNPRHQLQSWDANAILLLPENSLKQPFNCTNLVSKSFWLRFFMVGRTNLSISNNDSVFTLYFTQTLLLKEILKREEKKENSY